MDQHTITFRALGGETLLGYYNPKKTTLKRVIDTFFKNYDRVDARRGKVNIVCDDFGVSVLDLDQSALMSELGFSACGNVTFRLEEMRGPEVDEDALADELLGRMDSNMHIFCKTLTGKTMSIDVNSSLRIDELKLLIRKKEGIPRCQQRLVWAGRNLEDEFTLADYNIQRESTIHLILNMRGGMFAESSGRNGAYGELESVIFVVEPDMVD